MEFQTAKRLYDIAISLGQQLGAIDSEISQMTDINEKKLWTAQLGEVFRVLDDQIINPILRQHPSLEPEIED